MNHPIHTRSSRLIENRLKMSHPDLNPVELILKKHSIPLPTDQSSSEFPKLSFGPSMEMVYGLLPDELEGELKCSHISGQYYMFQTPDKKYEIKVVVGRTIHEFLKVRLAQGEVSLYKRKKETQ